MDNAGNSGASYTLLRRCGAFFVLLLACLLVACGGDQDPDSPPLRKVLTMTVGAAPTGSEASYVGTIAARYVSKQGFRVSGTVVKRQVEVGQHVTVGQALLQLDPANLELTRQQAQAQVDAAKSKAAQARVDLGRDAELLKQNFISQAAYDRDKVALDTATAQLSAAQAQYAEAINQLDYGTLRAAVNGIVTSIDADVGEVMSSGKTAVEIARDGDREVIISIPESRLDQLHGIENMTVTLWAVSGKTWRARLREIDPTADNTTGTYDAHITVLNPDSVMRLGMTAYVHIKGGVLGQLYEVPLTALVYPKEHAPAIWKLGADGTVATSPVTVESLRGDAAYISAGLDEGDVIVTKGGTLLHEGEKVESVTEPPAGD